MPSKLRWIVALCLFGTSAVHAGVTVTPIGAQVENAFVNGQWQITVRAAGNPGAFVSVTATSGSNPVRYIKVQSVLTPPLTNAQVVLTVYESGGTFSYIRTIDVDSASPSADAEVWIGLVDISGVVGDPGSPHSSYVFADIVGDVRAISGITADLVSGPRLFGGVSTIGRVESASDGISGHIYAPEGAIDLVNASSNLGSSTNTVAVWAKLGIKSVQANSIWASIDSTVDGGDDDVWYVKARTGNFKGELICREIQSPNSTSGLDIAGALDADITTRLGMRRPITAASLPSGRTIKVGTSLSSTITLPSNGLAGQVIVNSTNGSGTWTGNVSVGGTSLATRPYYSNLSANIGGGAVGLAPFHLHGSDCDPPDQSSHSFQYKTIVILRHYGPVFWSFGSTPVQVWWRLPGTSEEWTALPPSDFGFAVGDNDREIVVDALTALDFDVLFDYRITPVAGVLKCAGVTGTPDVDPYEYILHAQ